MSQKNGTMPTMMAIVPSTNIRLRPMRSETEPQTSIIGMPRTAAMSTAFSASLRSKPRLTAYDTVKVAKRKNVAVSMTFAPIAMSTSRQWWRSVESSGTRLVEFDAATALKDGVSSTVWRIQKPITTSTAERMNGMRQPYERNASSLKIVLAAEAARLPSARPMSAPTCGMAP